MVVHLCDDNGNASIIHYSSYNCNRATLCILAAEFYALKARFDYCSTVAHDISAILSLQIPIEILTDFKPTFDTATNLTSLTEKVYW